MGEPFRVVQVPDGVLRGMTLAGRRVYLGLSQRQAADALGISVNDMAAIEFGASTFASDAEYARAVDVLERAVGGAR